MTPSGIIKQKSHYALLLVISLIVLTPRLDAFPPTWYDEGYNTHAANMLAQYGFYGTYTTRGYELFDPGISSGPPLIVPATLSFNLFGVGVGQARLVSVIYTILAFLGLYGVATNLYGRAAALFIVLALLVVPAPETINFLFVGRQFLGESAALAGVIFGLWFWFHSWQSGRWSSTLFAGVAFGVAVLSKPHVGIVLLPTFVVIAGLRTFRNREGFIKSFMPTIVMLGIFGSWMLLQRIETTPQPPRAETLDLAYSIRIHLFSGLWGRPLPRSAQLVIGVMVLATLVGGWRLFAHRPRLTTSAQWAEAMIVLLALFTYLWFAFLSIGWPRYAYPGFTLSLGLLGKLGWDGFQALRQRMAAPTLQKHAYNIAIACLALLAVLVNGYPILQFQDETYAQQAGDFIRKEIPRDAVIESWAWELDALSAHQEFHHPSQNYLFAATEQHFVEQQEFDLDYDPLQADPDYLIAGPFSDWTMIYDDTVVADNFNLLAEFGQYRIYQRIRD